MRQVPEVAIIGAGRVARHFCHYFDLIHLPYQQWSRATDPLCAKFSSTVASAKLVFILISDAAIEPFITTHAALLTEKILIHCSGRLVTPLAFGMHPLMTFSQDLYELECYREIPFVLDAGAPALNALLPALKNRCYYIPKSQKAFYHSLCVMSVNFSCILWQKMIAELKDGLHLPVEIIYPILDQTLQNLKKDPQSALTGPLVRDDQRTIRANLAALEGDHFQAIYRAFVDLYTNAVIRRSEA